MTGTIPPPNPLSYEGQVAIPFVTRTYDPQTTFNTFPISCVWINTSSSQAWMLVSKPLGVANWLPIGGGATQIGTITTPDAQVVHPVASNINFLQSGGINITGNDPTSPDIKFQVTGGGLPWTDVTGTTQAMAVHNGYVADNAGLVTLTLPATAAFGSVIAVAGKGSGGWKIAQNASQSIHCGTGTTTTGTGGSISSTNANDCIFILCTTADTTFTMLHSVGNLTLV
jgi:hypothetical protein